MQGNQAKASGSPPLLIDDFRRKYSWACGVTRSSEASQTQYRKDLKKAFDEIDGLIAGFTFLDGMHSTDPGPPAFTIPLDNTAAASSTCNQPTDPMYEYAVEISDDDLFEGDEPSSDSDTAEKFPDPQTQPMATQWAAIKNLRDEMEHHHGRFASLPCVAQNPILAQLRETFHDAKAIRKTGTLILRDTLDGFSPSKLKDVFAFASLSYSVSKLLFKEKRIEEMQILDGLRVWRDAITDREEKDAFGQLAQELWPEARNHLHFFPLPEMDLRNDVAASLSRSQDLSGAASNRPHGLHFSGNNAGGLSSSAPASWLTVPTAVNYGQESLSFFDLALDMTDQFHNAWNLSEVNPRSTSFLGQPPLIPSQSGAHEPPADGLHLPDSMRFDLTSNALFDSVDGAAAGTVGMTELQDTHLRNTFVFLVVVAFLNEIQDLLCILSGSGLPPKPDKLFRAEIEEQRRLYKSIKEEYFEQRWSHGRGSHRRYNALLCVAKMFAREAYLRTTAEVKHYLVSIAAAVFPPGEQFEDFVQWVLHNGPSDASATKKHRSEPEPPEKQWGNKMRKRRTCDVPGCKHTCQTPSGLNKHKREVHQQSSVIQCPRCNYSNVRRDRVRKHFQNNHGSELPEFLKCNGGRRASRT